MPSRVHFLTYFWQLLYLFFVAAVERAGIKPEDVEEVFYGNVLSAKYVGFSSVYCFSNTL